MAIPADGAAAVPNRVSRLAPLVLAITAAALLAACGDAESPADPPVTNAGTTPAPTSAPQPGPVGPGTPEPAPAHPTPEHGATAGRRIEFVDGFEAGVAAAKDDDQLLFVYVGRHNPT